METVCSRCSLDLRDLHSSPTRRSSDLCLGWAACRRAGWRFSGGLLLAAGCGLKLAPLLLTPSLSPQPAARDRKSTRLNSSHVSISYAVFCLKKKKRTKQNSSYTVTT